MQLIGRLVQDRLEVHQEGGWGLESKSALRSVSTEAQWFGDRKTWVYPYSPGSLQGLVDTASMLGFKLMLDKELLEQYGRIQSETDHELGVRRLIQTYMDDAKLPIASYVTQPVPPPWRHQQIAWHWIMRVRTMYLALKPGCVAEGSPVLTERGWVPIQDVLPTDRVWDGVEWVAHEGVINQGRKSVSHIGTNVSVTSDHHILTADGMIPASAADMDSARIIGMKSLDHLEIQAPDHPIYHYENVISNTYDLLNCGPRHRFQCGWMILSNCGKTRVGADAIRGKHELGQVRDPDQFPLGERPSAIDPTRMLPARWCVRGGVLVVCPRVVISEWVEQLMRWQNIKAIPILGTAEKKRYRAGSKAWVHICAYDSLESVEGNEYDGIIGDELHYIATEGSNRYERMMALRKYATWAMGLSGTPISNMLPSLWSQYHWLDGGRTLGPSFEAYKKKYFSQDGRKVTADDNAEARVARATSRITFFLTMQQAFPDKAHKVQTVVRIPMTKEQSAYYEMLRKKTAAEVMGGKVTVVEALTRLMKLLQVTQGFVMDDNKQAQQFSSGKLNALEEMLTAKGDMADLRVIVWCEFRQDLISVTAMLKRHGIDHMALHGAVPDNQRGPIIDTWNNDYRKRVFVGMMSMGIGINLHAPRCIDDQGQPARCFTTVFYGLNWKVTQLEQAMDRVYRGDQVEICSYRYLLSDDLDESDDNGEPLKPIDVRIYDCLQEKLQQGVRFNEESVDYVRRLLGA